MSFRVSLIVGIATISTSALPSYAVVPDGNPPVFSQFNYNVTVDVSPPGLETFTINGSARDADAQDTVTVYVTGQRPSMRFSTSPGNPAVFVLDAVGLTYADRGFYEGFFTAYDNAPRMSFGSASWRVTVVPEPTLVGIVVCGVAAAIRHRPRRV